MTATKHVLRGASARSAKVKLLQVQLRLIVVALHAPPVSSLQPLTVLFVKQLARRAQQGNTPSLLPHPLAIASVQRVQVVLTPQKLVSPHVRRGNYAGLGLA